MKIRIFIDGQPPRTTHQSGTRISGHHTYKTRALKDAESWLLAGLKEDAPEFPEEGPVLLDCEWRYKPTKKITGWKTTRPDTDNLMKTLKDVMTSAGYWLDDAQVVSETCRKVWSSKPGIEIYVESL